MIKIQVSETKMREIEEKHWEWFNNYYKEIKENVRYKSIDKEIKNLLDYITQPEILKIIVIGKLHNKEDKEKSVQYITENILKKYPRIFHESVENSVKSFLKNKRKTMTYVRKNNKDYSKQLIKIKDKMKLYFQINKDILKKYIDDLESINKKIESIKINEKQIRNFSKDKFISFKFKEEGLFKKANSILSEIFNYDVFTSEGKTDSDYWGAYKLLKELNIITCPYCNRSYIHTYISKSGMCRADVDHFYPKSKYPFLAVSLYNFIPSCHTCNSSFKNSTDNFLLPHLYPYEDEFGEKVKFNTNFYTCENIDNKSENKKYDISYLLGNSNNFKIKINIDDTNDKSKVFKVENSIDTFHLEALYNFHKDYVRELIKKAIIYNESRVDELYNQYPELFSSREEVVQMVVSNYINEEDLGKRPLSKLTKDICEELGLR